MCGKGCTPPTHSHAQQPSLPFACTMKRAPPSSNTPQTQESRAPCFVLPPSAQRHHKHRTLFEMEERTVKARLCCTCFSPWEGDENKACVTDNSHVAWKVLRYHLCCVSPSKSNSSSFCFQPQSNRTMAKAVVCFQPALPRTAGMVPEQHQLNTESLVQ